MKSLLSFIFPGFKGDFFLQRLLFAVLLFAFTLTGAACTVGEEVGEVSPAVGADTVRIVYVEWVSEIASAHVVKAVIEERLGLHCELLPVTAISMWESVAAGDQDGMVAAWLPSLHGHYYAQVSDKVENLGPNLEGVDMGLVVPAYVTIDSIPELKEQIERFESRIIGIDPEAGLMESTLQAIEAYALDDYELVSGSDLTMTSAIEIAVAEERWIVVTGWTPHWKFARWDLKYLEDPLKVYGDSEYIGTVVRQGLQEDMPEVYAFLDNFYWTTKDMEQVMLWFRVEGMEIEDAARRWIEENEDIVDQWIGR
jgi:glycine betaine/proline transport system substrate-binding protein